MTAVTRRALMSTAVATGAALAFAGAPATAEAALPTLRRGSRGSSVTSLQNKLNRLGYWTGTADGAFGHLTQQAVYAVQKVAGLGRDGIVGARTWDAINRGVRPRARTTSGMAFEVDLKRQILLCYTGGRVAFILNTSTGSGQYYYSGGVRKKASTPTGNFSFYRLHSAGWESGPLGSLYRPGYFYRGWAIHGATSIPPYPASHGCARISTQASDMLWRGGWFKSGRRVLVY